MSSKTSIYNVGLSVLYRIIRLLGLILVRRLLIQYAGNEANGLHSFYLGVMGFLTVAELGVGEAIAFAMYRPIVERRETEVAALYQLFRKAYRIIGAVIFGMGLAMIPLLPKLVKGNAALDIDLEKTFFLMLVSVVVTYLFGAESSLINAHKRNYVTAGISFFSAMVQYVLQAMVLIATGSFEKYLYCVIAAAGIQWLLTRIAAEKNYGSILHYSSQFLGEEQRKSLSTNIKAMFLHRLGYALVNSADSVVISALLGVAILGKFSNYITIVTAMFSVITLVFTPLTSTVGHMLVTDRKQAEDDFWVFSTANYLLGVVFFLGYYAVVDPLIELLFGHGLEMGRSVVFVITVNYFVQFMRETGHLYHNAAGAFYYDRWKPFAEGTLNVILSLALAVAFQQRFGEEAGAVGVILATIITNLTICHIVEPYVLFRHVFCAPVRRFYLRNYGRMGLFVAVLWWMHGHVSSAASSFGMLLRNGCMSLLFSAAVAMLILLTDREFRIFCRKPVRKWIWKKDGSA